MKKLLSLVLAFSFSFNVLAGTAANELEKSLNDYQYALTVEWDQKDQKFYDAQTQAFFNRMGTLIKENGLTQEEILSLAEKKVNDKKTLEALKLKLALAGQAKNSSELASVLQEVSKDMYSQGAAWNGDALIIGGVVVLVVALVGYEIWFNATHECVQWGTRWDCDSYTNCPHYSNRCYTDTTCGWEDYCVDYQKK